MNPGSGGTKYDLLLAREDHAEAGIRELNHQIALAIAPWNGALVNCGLDQSQGELHRIALLLDLLGGGVSRKVF